MSFRDAIQEKRSGGGNTTRPSTTQNKQQKFGQKNDFTVVQVYRNDDDDGLYGDDQFENTCSEIELLLSEINKSTVSIQKSTTTLGTAKDTNEFRESLSLIIKKASQNVETLSHHIQYLESYQKQIAHDTSRSKDKFRIEKLKNQIEQILNNYKKQTTQCLKKQKETLAQFKNNQERSNVIINSKQNAASERDSLLRSQQVLENERMDNEIEFNTKILMEREKDILDVESCGIQD